MDLGCSMSHRDMLRALDAMKEAYPELLFFAPEYFHDVPGRLDPARRREAGDRPSKDLRTFHQNAESCFAALAEDQATFQRAPAIRMAMRAPWPEEIGSIDVMLMRGESWRSWRGHLAYDSDDPAFWRVRGRLATTTIPAIEPRTILSVEANTNRRLLHPPPQLPNERAHPPESFGEAQEIDSLCQFAQVLAWYNIDDTETAGFMADFKRHFNKQITTRTAYYDPATGRFLDRDRGRYKHHIGRDLLAWLCRHPGIYDGITMLNTDNPGFEGRLAAYGPAPDFKAEVFLEEGLPIDDIDGLTVDERDRLLRRHEKKLKAG
jgi:hypothetical protein